MSIEINKHLFAVCCGLVATGYSLANVDDSNIKKLANRIITTRFPEDVYNYFPYARTDQCEVNPYWPRGSIISSACFFFDKPLSAFYEFLQSCGSNEHKNAEFRRWIGELPNVLAEIEAINEFTMMLNTFETIFTRRYNEIEQKIDATITVLNNYGFTSAIKIFFAPTLLKSVDYAQVDNKLYVIANDFDDTVALHEYLHPLISEIHPQLEKLIDSYSIEKFVDISKMHRFGYMADFSLESKCHALEECIVRGIVGIMTTSFSVDDYCKSNVNMGFLFVPKIINYAKHMKPTNNNLVKFINGAINI